MGRPRKLCGRPECTPESCMHCLCSRGRCEAVCQTEQEDKRRRCRPCQGRGPTCCLRVAAPSSTAHMQGSQEVSVALLKGCPGTIPSPGRAGDAVCSVTPVMPFARSPLPRPCPSPLATPPRCRWASTSRLDLPAAHLTSYLDGGPCSGSPRLQASRRHAGPLPRPCRSASGARCCCRRPLHR